MKLRFLGAAQTVTGSQTLCSHLNYKFVVDCGLYQGPPELRAHNWDESPHWREVSAIVLTHAHIDHSGLIPRWVRWGWRGPILCTPATAELLSVMLLDAAKLQEEDAEYANQTKYSYHDPALSLYDSQDAQRAIEMIYAVPYHEKHEIAPGIGITFRRAGHILGSAFVEVSYLRDEKTRVLIFSGDLGGGNSKILRPAEIPLECDHLVLESTYGDRQVPIENRDEVLAEVVTKVINRGGTLIIPAFALGRTQDLLFALCQLRRQNKIPKAPVYLDSPMANAVTEIYRRQMSELVANAQNHDLEDALSPDFFKPIETSDESMLLCMSDEPKIVLSASGMLQGGRVLHHLKQKLSDEKSGVLFVGYQGAGTKGQLLQSGIDQLRIHHKEIAVEAGIWTLEGFSAHADANSLVHWVEQFKTKPQTVFLNHGEPKAQQTLADRLAKELKVPAKIPQINEEFDLSC